MNFTACSAHIASWHIAKLGYNIFSFLQSGKHAFSVLLRVYKSLLHHVVPSNVKPCNGFPQFIPASHNNISFYALLTSLSTVYQGSVFLQFCDKIQQSNLTCTKYSPTCIQQLAISKFCNTNGLYYIDNRNVRADCLYKDGLHLIDKEKIVLANNFIINLNQNFLTTHMHHPPDVFLNQECILKPTSNCMEANLQILQEDRIKFHKNPLLGYLNMNSLRNKVTDSG